MEATASSLEESRFHFIWGIKGDSQNLVPLGFEEHLAGKGLMIKGSVPQQAIMGHRAVGSYLTHCGWNSALEGLLGGALLLAWPITLGIIDTNVHEVSDDLIRVVVDVELTESMGKSLVSPITQEEIEATIFLMNGLQVNFSISELYSGRVGSIELLSIMEITGLKIGSLPVRYLGIPLVTRSLKNGNCDSLVEKITKSIQSWASRCLSYAGRLQLTQFVLFSMQNFWCRIFLLPSKVVKKVNKLCSSFLWKGRELSAKGVKVGWDKVCYPEAEGGLGLRTFRFGTKLAR
ncbi:hypothetical protein J1N35_016764 [Gossypium stocksii]|uniref:Reverse transcriptase domain-containing protein n=1 Tax=Gossypium stocksii TaxID=47602 RepID=A0A9D3VLX9_9ROSI|nr:hypothetical protein J1N35_016764 [Gossypium stocksii]